MHIHGRRAFSDLAPNDLRRPFAAERSFVGVHRSTTERVRPFRLVDGLAPELRQDGPLRATSVAGG